MWWCSVTTWNPLNPTREFQSWKTYLLRVKDYSICSLPPGSAWTCTSDIVLTHDGGTGLETGLEFSGCCCHWIYPLPRPNLHSLKEDWKPILATLVLFCPSFVTVVKCVLSTNNTLYCITFCWHNVHFGLGHKDITVHTTNSLKTLYEFIVL